EGETRDVVVQVQATDSHGLTATNDVTVTVTGTNDGPVLAATVETSQDGLSSESAAISGKQIVAENPIATSGIYWIDPDGPSGDDPFRAFIDTTTQGGGWTLGVRSFDFAPATEISISTTSGNVSASTS